MKGSSLSTLIGRYNMPAVPPIPIRSIAPRLSEIEEALRALRGGAGGGPAIDRYLADSAAARFHLHPPAGPRLIVILGGTGTGKSTLLNRLLGSNVSAASFRRTFTAGAVAVSHVAHPPPSGWLGIEHQTVAPADLPARGQPDRLMVVHADHALLKKLILIDTPDLDGDQPAHHSQADRAFRWAQSIVFLVTPEKYQMTELPPYYRLTRRYGVPALFVMNKAESRDVLDDYLTQLAQVHGAIEPGVFCIPRDDSAFEPPSEQNLGALISDLESGRHADGPEPEKGLRTRITDLLARGRDQVIQPLLDARTHADRIIDALRSMTAATPEVDVHPITSQLQRRLQQKSVLYLMGPQRVFDRVRQVPLMLARLPRNTWDLFRHGQLKPAEKTEEFPDDWQKTGPNFQSALVDQMAVLQSRIDDVIHAAPQSPGWISADLDAHAAARIDPSAAGAIAEEELAELRKWLEHRWNAVPRDTRVIQALLKVIPGGRKLIQLSEAAPYLLAIVVASHHAVFGGVDLMILGGYSLATWMTEKMSNEVAGRTRKTNERIAERFTQLAQSQVDRMIHWAGKQAPPRAELERLSRVMDELQERIVTV